MPDTWSVISAIIGWTYILAWSFSFYPQFLLNIKRQSVTGLSPDYIALNILGFTCYTVYCAVFLLSDNVQEEYRRRSSRHSEPLVRVNDAVFAAHALLLSILTYSQICFWGYERGSKQQASRFARLFIAASIFAIFILCILAQVGSIGWIDVIYGMSYIKLMVSLSKCVPQLYLNYQRQSTVGWSIINILLDFVGGVLSLLQLFIDCAIADDWSAITGNAVKTGLGFLSIVTDILFMTQHYILYYGKEPEGHGHTPEREPLIHDQLRRQ